MKVFVQYQNTSIPTSTCHIVTEPWIMTTTTITLFAIVFIGMIAITLAGMHYNHILKYIQNGCF